MSFAADNDVDVLRVTFVNYCLLYKLNVLQRNILCCITVITLFLLQSCMFQCLFSCQLLEDVFCGRHKIIIISLCLLLCGTVFLSLVFAQYFSHFATTPFSVIQKNNGPFAIAGLLFVNVGIYSYRATIIQLGLYQLLQAPSDHLGLCIHWIEWCTILGIAVGQAIISVLYNCKHNAIINIMFSTICLSLVSNADVYLLEASLVLH